MAKQDPRIGLAENLGRAEGTGYSEVAKRNADLLKRTEQRDSAKTTK